MRIKFNKKIEFFLKKFFFSQSFLLKRRLDRAIKKNEEEEIKLVKKYTTQDTDSLDIGVYRGIYAYEMSKYSKTVHAFEANPLIFNDLRVNLQKVKKNIIFYNYALSNEAGNIKIKVPIRNPQSDKKNYEEYYKLGTATVQAENRIEEYEEFNVNSKKIDGFNFENKISLIKIDVEGHEIPVIEGGIEIIRKNKPVLIVEIDEKYSKNKALFTINYINSIGYNSYYYCNDTLESTDKLDDLNKYSNFVFLPK